MKENKGLKESSELHTHTEKVIDQALYIQINHDQETEQNLKLVRQKESSLNKPVSPKQRKKAKLAEFQDVSDVEPVQTEAQMLQCSLNLETLEQILERFRAQLSSHGSSISEINSHMNLKTSDRALGTILERFCMGIPKEVGEKPHKFKLDDKEFLKENNGNADEIYLKQNVEKFLDKLDIVSASLIRLETHRKQQSAKLTLVEDKQKEFMSVLDCRELVHTLETQLKKTIKQKLADFETRQTDLESQFGVLRTDSQTQIKNIQSEVLWRIKDAEELIKSRVSEQKLINYIAQMKTDLEQITASRIKSQTNSLSEQLQKLETTQSNNRTFLETQIDDLKSSVKLQDRKILDLASKENLGKLETSLATQKQSVESEFEQLQHFVRTLNISITGCQTSVRTLQSSGQTQQTKHTPDVSQDQVLSAESRNMSQDLLERLVTITNKIDQLEINAKQTAFQLKDCIGFSDLQQALVDKVTLQQLQSSIPDIALQEQKLASQIQNKTNELDERINLIYKQVDAKIVLIRKDMDIDQFVRQLKGKADAEQVGSDLKNHEFKIGLLDNNVMLIANDFQLFQTTLNQIHASVSELQEANKDVILGKRTLNCLSCGTNGQKEFNVVGNDGKLYKTNQTKIDFIENQPTNRGSVSSGIGRIASANLGSRSSLPHQSFDLVQNLSLTTRQQHKRNRVLHSAVVHNHLPDAQNIPEIVTSPKNATLSNAKATATQRKKVPFGFKVQQDRMELLKTQSNLKDLTFDQFVPIHVKARPDSAKVVGTKNRLAQLVHELEEHH